jgi:hypothetical protein
MEPHGEASAHGTTTASSWPVKTGRRLRLRHPIMAWWSTAGATELLARAEETTAPSILATTTGSPEIRLRSPAARAILRGRTQRSRHAASQWRKPRRPKEPAKALKVISQLART